MIPNWNGERWLPGCLAAIFAQSHLPRAVVVVDNGSTDRSVALLSEHYPQVKLIAVAENEGFASAANRGIAAVDCEAVALINTDVVLAKDWLARMGAALAAHPECASIACKMVDLEDASIFYDTGDFLRRDGVCEQRGRFQRDHGQYDRPGPVFAACAGAALYRKSAVVAVGGFDQRYFCYLEDVDLGLRLALAGWSCHYEPAVARHAGGGSSHRLRRPVDAWVERNTLLLVVKAFPWRWLPYVLYRQLGWAWHAYRQRRLRAHLGGALAAVPLLKAMWVERRALAATAKCKPAAVVERRPIRGARAG